jgi:hypothetical protein
MSNIFDTLQSKRREELQYEKLNYHNIINIYEKTIKKLEEKNEFSTQEKDNSNTNLLKINQDIDNIKNSNINDTIQNILEEIDVKRQNIFKYQESTIDETQKTNLKNERIGKIINEMESEKENVKKNLQKKKESKYFILEKNKELIKQKDKLDKHLEEIDKNIKELNIKTKTKIFDNVTRRYNILQEYVNNQDLKKNIDKTKIEMTNQIKDKEGILQNFRSVKDLEKEDILNQYNNKLAEGVPNILEEMESMEEKLKIFDLETEKELYFLKNNIKSLVKKLQNIDKYMEKKIEAVQQNLVGKDNNYNKIKDLKQNKTKIEGEIKDLNIDITFLEKEYESEMDLIFNTIKHTEQTFLTTKDTKENEIIENKLLLAEIIKNNKLSVDNRQKEIGDLEIKLTNIKDEYYNSIRKLELNKETILSFLYNFETKIQENNDIIVKHQEEHLIKKKNLEDRILYLEKQNIILTLNENEMRN